MTRLFSSVIPFLRLALIIGAVFVLFFSFPVSLGAQEGAIVRPDPPTFQVGAGQVETIRLVIENAKDVYGIDVRAKFDPSVIEIVDADETKEGVQFIPGDFIKPDFVVRNVADNQKGTLQYVVTQTNPSPPVSGSGVILSLLVRGKTQGKQTTLTVDFVEIADRRGIKLPVKGQSGTVIVVPPKVPTPTATLVNIVLPTPTALPTAKSVGTPGATTQAAATETRPTPPPARSETDSLFLNLSLGAIVLCSCIGICVLLAIAGWLLYRRMRRPRLPSREIPF